MLSLSRPMRCAWVWSNAMTLLSCRRKTWPKCSVRRLCNVANVVIERYRMGMRRARKGLLSRLVPHRPGAGMRAWVGVVVLSAAVFASSLIPATMSVAASHPAEMLHSEHALADQVSSSGCPENCPMRHDAPCSNDSDSQCAEKCLKTPFRVAGIQALRMPVPAIRQCLALVRNMVRWEVYPPRRPPRPA